MHDTIAMADAPERCDVCDGHHRARYAGDCRGWDHNFTRLDLLTAAERARRPKGAVVPNAAGEPLLPITTRTSPCTARTHADYHSGTPHQGDARHPRAVARRRVLNPEAGGASINW